VKKIYLVITKEKKNFLYFFLFNKKITNLTSAGNIIFDEQRGGGLVSLLLLPAQKFSK